MRLVSAMLCVCSVVSLAGCSVLTRPTAATFAGNVATPQMANQSAAFVFPTGAKLSSRRDIANTITSRDKDIFNAVVITSGHRAFVSLVTRSRTLSQPQERRVSALVIRYAGTVNGVYITANPDAYSQFSNFTRYLDSGLYTEGMLLTWRSIVRSTWPQI